MAFFDALSVQDAQQFPTRYLEVEGKALGDMIPRAEAEGVSVNFTVASVPDFLKWILMQVRTLPGHIDPQTPEWIRVSASKKELIDFAEESKPLLMRASFYLGEAFVRHYEPLHWTIGNPGTIERNQPVVSGFLSGIEMGPIMVTESLFLRILGDGSPPTDIDKAVDWWCRMIPKH